MKRKTICQFLIFLLLLAGCGNTGAGAGDGTDNAGSGTAVAASDPVKEPYILVTVDEFRDYYDVRSDEISDDVIERFVFDYYVDREKMENYSCIDTLRDIIRDGDDVHLAYGISQLRSFQNIFESCFGMEHTIPEETM